MAVPDLHDHRMPVAAVYAIAATGLVVTYTTSGIFNFAHGAFAMLAAFTYWQVHVGWGLPAPVAPHRAVVLAPLFGAGDRAGDDARASRARPKWCKIVVTVSLMLGLLGLALCIWPADAAAHVPAVLRGHSGRDPRRRTSATTRCSTMVIAAIAVASALRLVLTGTRLGVAMRAVVDDRSLLELNGGRPGRMSDAGRGRSARSSPRWPACSSPPIQNRSSATALTLLVIDAYAAAVVGRLRSLPATFLGALVLGLAESTLVGYIPGSTAIGPISSQSFRAALPAIVLFVVSCSCPRPACGRHGVTRATGALPMPTIAARVIGGGRRSSLAHLRRSARCSSRSTSAWSSAVRSPSSPCRSCRSRATPVRSPWPR